MTVSLRRIRRFGMLTNSSKMPRPENANIIEVKHWDINKPSVKCYSWIEEDGSWWLETVDKIKRNE